MVKLFEIFFHLDLYLTELVSQYGTLTYALLFGIIFAETGLVFFPFLPGDSLLFATGAIAALGSLNIFVVISLLILAAILGDTVNYWIGHFFGERIIASKKVPLIKTEHIRKTEEFYAKHGSKMIILARFVPIVRTFAPFVAGIGRMHYRTFLTYNVVGGVAWVLIFTLLGYFFGNVPLVQKNFEIVIVVIILISVVPMFIEWYKNKQSKSVNTEQ